MKIEQLYNIDSFEALGNQKDDTMFKDSAGGIVLARNLEAIDPRIFEQQYAGLSLLNSGISVDNTGGAANLITKIKLGDMGDFSYAGNASGNKGKLTINAEDDSLRVYQLEAYSEWTKNDIEQSNLQNINLVQRMLTVHNKRYQQKLDEIGYIGHTFNLDGSSKTTGLLNEAGFISGAAGGAIDTLTGDQQYQAIADLITDQWTGVTNVEAYMANKVTMPTRVHNVISRTVMNSAGSAMTVLAALKANFAGIDFQVTSKADTVANGGLLATSATVAWSNNQDSMLLRVPKPLEIGQIVNKGSFDFQVDSYARIGGLDVAENLAGRILTGL